MSEENGNGVGTLKAFAQMYGWKKWTAVNDPALRALVADKTAQEDRLWALAVLRSWGHPSGPKKRAIDPDGQKHLKLSDLARELRVSKQTASRWGKALAAKNRLHVLDSGVYPVDDPTKPFELANGTNSPRLPGQNEAKYKIFIEDWKRSQPDKARREKELRTELKKLNREKLAEFKAWLKSQTPGTNAENGPGLPPETVPDSSDFGSTLPDSAAPPNKDEDDTYIEAASSSFSDAEQPNETTTNSTPDSQSQIGQAVLEAIGFSDEELVRQLRQACRAKAPDCTDGEITHFIQLKGHLARGKPSPGGYLLTTVSNCFEGASFQQFRAQRARQTDAKNRDAESPEPSIAAEIQRLERQIEAAPAHQQVEQWRAELAALKRKPAASEPSAKAQKAGQR